MAVFRAFDAVQVYVVLSLLSVPMNKYMHIIMVVCLEWWNSHFIIRCSFETGHWTQIPQAFPTLWRMLMSRIQHLRTRLPVHIDFVPVEKPGEETKDKNHQSTTQANTKVVNRCSSASAQQCSNIIWMEGSCHSNVLLECPFFLQFASLDSGRFVLAPQVSPQ